MCVRLLAILQSLTKGAPAMHKHPIRQSLQINVEPSEIAEASTSKKPIPEKSEKSEKSESEESGKGKNLLHSTTDFLRVCIRRKNSPLLRDAIRLLVGITAVGSFFPRLFNDAFQKL